ncbi:hypothetical protein [Guptibacillus hwajinpoensis]|uniref:hypothetical protein n=1 Tax=Guptibacillus hwajinpoensis TaxID=208199 RepID=UPI00273FC3A0|nr:hypothetical protein [Pseudalkalibacillus hwajinpoensis]WLR58365.1 hypothetical protein LC071_14275 [Pseudalkalibacillus hwajinpoensis]
MKRKFKVQSILLLIFVVSLLAGCSQSQSFEEEYDGQALNIAVIGEVPSVRENMNFTQIDLNDLLKEKITNYDAVFIMKDYLLEAAKEEYTNVYLESEVPFFFVESKASILPFVDDEMSYEEYAKKVGDEQHYIVSLKGHGKDQEYDIWKYSYYVDNNEFDKKNVKPIYSQVFKRVSNE